MVAITFLWKIVNHAAICPVVSHISTTCRSITLWVSLEGGLGVVEGKGKKRGCCLISCLMHNLVTVLK